MSDSAQLDQYVDERVLVETTTGDQIAGTLYSFDDDFSLTLTGNGGPDPDEMISGDFPIEYVDGERTLNGAHVLSIEPWDRPFAD